MERQVQLNRALAKENDALREQAQLDRGIIESLRCLEKARGEGKSLTTKVAMGTIFRMLQRCPSTKLVLGC